MGRLEPVGQLELRIKTHERSFSGPPPAASGPDTPETQIQGGVYKCEGGRNDLEQMLIQCKYVKFSLFGLCRPLYITDNTEEVLLGAKKCCWENFTNAYQPTLV